MKKNLFLILYMVFSAIHAQNVGDIDDTFGTNGVAEFTLDINNIFHGISLQGTQILSNGKILVLGIANNGCSSVSNGKTILMRLNSDGSFDTSFHGTGYKFIPNSFYYNISKFGTDQFLISGAWRVNGSLKGHIAKIDIDGNIIQGFANEPSGVSNQISFGIHNSQNSIGGLFYDTVDNTRNPVIRSMDNNGIVDSSFGVNGTAAINPNYKIMDLITDGSGNIYFAAREVTGTWTQRVIIGKFTSNGVMDTSFGINGIYENINYREIEQAKLTTTTNGAVICAFRGERSSTNVNSLVFVKLDTNGNLYPNFSNNVTFNNYVHFNWDISIFELSDDSNIYISGKSIDSFYILRFDSHGIIDNQFATNGIIQTPSITSSSGIQRPAVLVDNNKILFVGNKIIVHCSQTKWKTVMTQYFVDNILSVQESYQETDVKLYPVPASNELFLTSNIYYNSYEIMQVSGQLISKNTIDTRQSINVSSLKSGVYLVKLYNDVNPLLTTTRRFIKE